jgi:hypothetical protein
VLPFILPTDQNSLPPFWAKLNYTMPPAFFLKELVPHPMDCLALVHKLNHEELLMRTRIFVFAAVVAMMLAGCTETPQYMGAAVDRDQNVLTGGPITGTTLQDLPQAVKDTLKQVAPHAEIASIEKTKRNGRTVYAFSFLEADNYTPDVFLRDDGPVKPQPVRAQK